MFRRSNIKAIRVNSLVKRLSAFQHALHNRQVCRIKNERVMLLLRRRQSLFFGLRRFSSAVTIRILQS